MPQWATVLAFVVLAYAVIRASWAFVKIARRF